jgi:hypothetical protein
MKRVMMIVLALSVCIGGFAQTTVKYVMPGDPMQDNDLVIQAVNARPSRS